MATRKSRKKRIDPRSYVQILRHVKLDELSLDSCSVIQKRENLLNQKELKISITDRASYMEHDGKVTVTHKYYLTAKNPEVEKDFVIKISATFCLTYLTKSPFEKEFFEVFKKINLPVNSWPYFREFVQNMTQRMNIPSLTLPLLMRG